MPSSAPRRDRLDLALVARGLASTRSKAQALILAGRVRCDGVRIDKPGARVGQDSEIVVSPGPRYVGRGGFKLAGALEAFDVDVAGRDCLDVGASTGGFTQVLLEAGAARVIALDVGRGQLDWGLRNDPRVRVLEGVNARYLEPGMLPLSPAIATIDVSFISLQLVLPPVVGCLLPGGEVLALVKPQFEVGRRDVERGGLVRSARLHVEALGRVGDCAAARGCGLLAVAAAALRGAEGNQEYFLHLARDRTGLGPGDARRAISDAVAAATGGRP